MRAPLAITAARTRHGFTLLEVMVSLLILAVGLSALFTSESGAIRIAQRARTTTIAALLARCKMGEVEESVAREGWPAGDTDGRDECCEGAEHDGFACEWSVKRIVLPDEPAEEGDDPMAQLKSNLTGGAAAGAEGAAPGGAQPGVDPAAAAIPLSGGIDSLLSGSAAGAAGGGGGDPLVSMVMQYTFPIMKPIIEEQVRRVTVTVSWREGSSDQSLDVVQYIVNELPMLPPEQGEEEDPNNPTGTGTPGSTTPASGSSPQTNTPAQGSRP